MGRQYEYLFAGDSHYHGFLSNCPGERIDQVAEEGIGFIADCRLQIAD